MVKHFFAICGSGPTFCLHVVLIWQFFFELWWPTFDVPSRQTKSGVMKVFVAATRKSMGIVFVHVVRRGRYYFHRPTWETEFCVKPQDGKIGCKLLGPVVVVRRCVCVCVLWRMEKYGNIVVAKDEQSASSAKTSFGGLWIALSCHANINSWRVKPRKTDAVWKTRFYYLILWCYQFSHIYDGVCLDQHNLQIAFGRSDW